MFLLLLAAQAGGSKAVVTSLPPAVSGPSQPWAAAAALALQHGTSTRNLCYFREFNLKCSADAMNGHLSSESPRLRSF